MIREGERARIEIVETEETDVKDKSALPASYIQPLTENLHVRCVFYFKLCFEVKLDILFTKRM